jgi:IS4 transposase
MAHKRDSQIRRSLTSLISPRRIRQLAHELGVVRRRRKIDVVALVYALVLGFSSDNRRTLAALRRAYERATGTCLVASAFYDRFNVALARLMKRLLQQALEGVAARTPRLHRTFRTFQQVLVADGTVIRLHQALAAAFPSVWPNHMPASAKLHVVINVVGRGPSTVRIARGSRQDVRLLRIGGWVRGKLLLFDLGYFKGLLFQQIARNGGFFLTRLKAHCNPVVRASAHAAHRCFVGQPLQSMLPRLGCETLDVDVDLHFLAQRHPPRGHGHTPVRVVGVWNAAERRHHLYVTNVPRDRLAAKHISGVYAARWEVELFFRELKTRYHIDDVRSCRRHVTECLLYASLLTLVVSRRLYDLLAPSTTGPSQRHPIDRWAVLFSAIADQLLHLIVGPRAHRALLAYRLRRLILHEARDPNRRRLLLPVRAQLGQLRLAA